MTFALTPGKLGFKLGEVLVGLQSGTTDTPETIASTQNKMHMLGYMWNPDTLAYEVPVQGLTDTELRTTKVDVLSIDAVHNHTHLGRYFSGGYYNAAVANNASIDLLIQTGANSSPHTKVTVSNGGDALVYSYEDVTFSAAGTAVTVSNHNRNSTKVLDCTVTHSPTITGLGTEIGGVGYSAGGEKNASAGGSFGFSNELVLKPATAYLFRATNVSGAAAKIALMLECYQPTL